MNGPLGFFTVIFCFIGLTACMPAPEVRATQTAEVITLTNPPVVKKSKTPTQTKPAPTLTSTPTRTPLPTQTLTPSSKVRPDFGVFLDENPMMDIRQGPGCEYKPLREPVVNPDLFMPLEVLGKQGDWWLIALGNGRQGWIFGPVYEDNNFVSNTMDELPEIQATPVATKLLTEVHLDDLADTTKEAGETLVTFFNFLYDQRYQEAAELFGTSYNWLIMWNSNIDPSDRGALLRSACEVNGFDCLRINRIVESIQESAMEFRFKVEFLNKDGSLYKFRGPRDPNSEPSSRFLFRVVRNCDGKYFVATFPVYGG